MTLEPHYSPEPAQIRDSSQPYTENIRVQHIWVCKELPNQKGHGVIEMNKKILLHPSISATLVKVHLISHNPIHPINSRLLSGSYKKLLLKGQNFLSLPCAHSTSHGILRTPQQLSLDPDSLSHEWRRWLRSPLTFKFAFFTAFVSSGEATTLHGRLK